MSDTYEHKPGECRGRGCVPCEDLHSAAPDLLAAAEDILRDLDAGHDEGAEGLLGTIRCTATTLRAAIRRARGES